MGKSLLQFILFLSIPLFSIAQWSADPENPVVICNAVSDQVTVRSIPDESGGHFVFWIDKRDAVAGEAIYGQHITSDGFFLWPDGGKAIVQTAGKKLTDFRVAAWQQGMLIVWLQSASGQSDSLYSQYFDTTGAANWAQHKMIAATGGNIIYLSASGFGLYPNALGATIGYGTVTTGGYSFFSFNRIDFGGSLAFPVNNFAITYGNLYDYRSWTDNQNGVYVLMKGNGLGSDIRIQRYDETGTAVFGTAIEITGTDKGFGGNISMRTDGSGALYVIWDTNNGNVVATKITPSGNFAWATTHTLISDFNSGQSRSFAILAGEKIYVTWNDNRPPAASYFIYVQKLDTSGAVEWAPGGVQASNLGSYIPHPKLVISDSSSVVATYEVNGQFYVQKFRPDSTIKYEKNGDTLCGASTPFYADYQLGTGANGCTVAFWSSDDKNIFGARVCTEQLNVGLNEPWGNGHSISVYPNPSFDGIFDVEGDARFFPGEIHVTNAAGKRVAFRWVHAGKPRLELSNQPAGIYFLTVNYHANRVVIKLVKQ
jgi:hypothetical protein